MNHDAIESRRLELARNYDIEAEINSERLGYEPPVTRSSSLWRRVARNVEFQVLPHYPALPPRWRLRLRAYSGRRTLPDFCVVGPVKSGTMDLAVSLMAHPNVIPPFAREFWFADPEEWRIFYPTEREKQRHAARHGIALSLYCVPFLHGYEAVYRLSKIKPDTRIVLTLRDPVDRLYSHWKWDVYGAGPRRLAAHPFLSEFATYVNRALELFPTALPPGICSFPSLHTSIYWQAVRYWIECFGRENVRVLDVGEYFLDANSFLKEIQGFVGLPRVETLPAFSRKMNENPLKLPKPDEASLAKLREFFRPHNEKLWDVIGERFSWRS